MLRPVRKFVLRLLCHTQLQKSLMRTWEEVGVVCKTVRWGKGKKKYFCGNYFRQKYFCQKYFQNKYFRKKYFQKKYFRQKYFQKKYFRQKYFGKNQQKYFLKKYFCQIFFHKKVGAKPPCSPQGLGWYRAIARSQPSFI